MNLTDHILISLPNLEDPYFLKSLVYIADYDEDMGTNGWIINKQLSDYPSRQIRTSMGLTRDLPLFLGGPVNTNTAVVLHSPELKLQNTIQLNSKLSVTREKRIITMFNNGDFPEYWRVIVGQSGWYPNQLESEFDRNGTTSWTYTSYNHDLVWNTSPKDQWNDALKITVEEQTNALLASTFAD